MQKNQIYKILIDCNIISDISNMIIDYLPNNEYDNLINEFKVLMHFYNNPYGYVNDHMFRIVPRLLEAYRLRKVRTKRTIGTKRSKRSKKTE